jgi:hypothetical protein
MSKEHCFDKRFWILLPRQKYRASPANEAMPSKKYYPFELKPKKQRKDQGIKALASRRLFRP